MPALVMFNRKWLIASDDLIFSFIIETTLRIIWLPFCGAVIYIYMRDKQECDQANYITCILFIHLFDLISNAILGGIITRKSSKGAVMQSSERQSIPRLLYVKAILFIIEIISCIPLTWFTFQSQNWDMCFNHNHMIIAYLEALSVLAWIYIGMGISAIIFAYDPIGSTKFWNITEFRENEPKFLKKSKRMWENRLKFLFCCLSANKRNRVVYKDIADFLANFCKGIDLVPTDVLTGLVILSKKHASEKRRLKFLDSIYVNRYISINDDSIPSWMTIENALHFLRLAKSTYGWPIFFDTCNPCSLCVLTSRLKCCCSSRIAGADNCCYCNAAALRKVTGFTSDDVLYVSYHNTIHEPAFFVVVDRTKSSIVIGIRGTLSFADIVTDIDAEYEKMQDYFSREFYCHRGTLKSAKYIYAKLQELKILKFAFIEFPNYRLVVTGHSLGGSVGTILCFMLQSEYPDLQCYTYGPLAALSSSGTKLTYEFTFSVVVGDDLAPRLCVRSCVDLRNDILKYLQESKIQKYKLLLGACSRFMRKMKSFRNEDENFKSFDEMLKDDNEINDKPVGSFSSTERLYAPGRILYLEYLNENGIRSCWKTGFHFRRLIITPRNMRDHQPHRIQKTLQYLKDQQYLECETSYQNSALVMENNFHDETLHVI